MNYGVIKNCDIANGVGVRISLFVSGCRNHCKNCFQPETWAFDYGTPYTKETEDYIISLLDHPYIEGLSLLGGEPFEPENQRVLLNLLKRVRKELPSKTIWCYSGYLFENIRKEGTHPNCEVSDEFLSLLDVLVDGRFEEDKKDITLLFRGSSNQRIIDMKKTLASGSVVLWDEHTAKLK